MIYGLVDFGSTFTKLALVDGGTGALLSTSQHPTTIDTDVFEGYDAALSAALASAGVAGVDRVLAASSAAGGLRMVAVGLVDDLTASAAKRAALSAGAKVEGVWSGTLGDDAARQIRARAPDVILFAGGTDGGDRERVLHNARRLARAGTGSAVVVACNRDVADQVAAVFERTDHHTTVVDNVLPRIDVENAGPAREAIRELFIERVVRAKGLSTTSAFFDSVVMPTPAAVLACAELIAEPPDGLAGAGSAVIIDVGGATTDLHSGPCPRTAATADQSRRPGACALGAHRRRRPRRAVECRRRVRPGPTLDVRLHRPSTSAEILRAVEDRKKTPSYIPGSAEQARIDRALAASCIAKGMERHVGRLSTRYVPGDGADVVLTGRDLRESRVVLVTGGSVVRDEHAGAGVVQTAIERLDQSRPAPRSAVLLIDHHYVLAAAGLLATLDPVAAHRLLTTQVPGLADGLSQQPASTHS